MDGTNCGKSVDPRKHVPGGLRKAVRALGLPRIGMRPYLPPRSGTRAAALVLSTALLSLAAPGLHAADDAGVLGKGPAHGKTLSRSQLKQCLDLQDDLEARGKSALGARAALDSAKADFDRFEQQLQADRGSLDASDKAAVDAYNARLDQRKRMVADYEAKRPQVQEQAERYNALRQEWKGECENRPYRDADYAAVAKD